MAICLTPRASSYWMAMIRSAGCCHSHINVGSMSRFVEVTMSRRVVTCRITTTSESTAVISSGDMDHCTTVRDNDEVVSNQETPQVCDTNNT